MIVGENPLYWCHLQLQYRRDRCTDRLGKITSHDVFVGDLLTLSDLNSDEVDEHLYMEMYVLGLTKKQIENSESRDFNDL